MFFKNKNKFYCFTPEVMLVTFIIEFLLTIYVYLRHKSDLFNHLVIIIIILLGLFQLAEFRICSGIETLFWARIGFVVITFLPALGIHLITLITKKLGYEKISYIFMSIFVLIFSLFPESLSSAYCGGNYIIFRSPSLLMWFYGIYYFGFLFLGILECFIYLKKKKSSTLLWILIGYISFILPMGIVYIILPQTRLAVPSIMCGFAVFFALILAFKVVPEYNRGKKKPTHPKHIIRKD